MKLLQLEGQVFNRLTVLKFAYSKRRSFWLCKCKCGVEKTIKGDDLKGGKAQSCGCLRKDTKDNLIHGLSYTRFYRIWCAIRNRCYNPSHKQYKDYGGRGIEVYPDWQLFFNFKTDMYKSYKEHVAKYGELNTSIDRRNCNRNYEPDNCRWATRKEQSNNRRSF